MGWFAVLGIAFFSGAGHGAAEVPAARSEQSRVEALIDDLDAALISRDVSSVMKLIADSATIRIARCTGESQLDRQQFGELLASTLVSATSYIRVRSERRFDLLGDGLGGVFRSVLYEQIGTDEGSRSDEEVYVTVVNEKLRITSMVSEEQCHR